MANFGRALLEVGKGLNQLAGRQYDRERDAAMAMREENLARLRGEQDTARLDKQLTASADQAALDRGARKEESSADRTLRTTESEADRKLRREEGAADRAVTTQRYQREDDRNADTVTLRQITAIDERLAQLNDMMLKPGLEGQGGLADPAATSQAQAEISQLQKQKQQLSRERDLSLARSGNKGYQKISPEEAQRILASQTSPDAAPPAAVGQPPPAGSSVKPVRPQVAAQAPAQQFEVPPAPPVDPEMAARRAREGNRAIGGPPAGQGARDLFGAVGRIGDALTSRTQEGPNVMAVKQAIQGGKPPPPEALQAVRAIAPDRLKGVFGFTDADLKQLGL